MAENSSIQWTQHTWNPWQGCKKVSHGCKFCYMYRDKDRYNQDPTIVIRSAKATFNKPLTWKDTAMVFTCSWSDWFIEEADAWRQEAWEIIKKTPHLTYQILTKRPERIKQCLPPDWGEGYPNVWIGISIENEKSALERIKILCEIPAKVRFLSCEPLIDEISMRWKYVPKNWREESGSVGQYEAMLHIHWVIIGGESGNDTGLYRFRPTKIEWIEGIINDCKTNNVPVFVKQLGTHLAKELKLHDRHGGDISEWPENLKIREFPI
jgi:protein gp37